MNQSTFETLFEYGKKVYQGDMDLSTAVTKASAQNPEVAANSAKHYITWYSKMHTGEFLTWNSNSELLLYYAKRIAEEEGIDAGQLAIQSAKQFAKHVSRHDLEQDLDTLAQEMGIASSEEGSQKEAFRQWLKKATTPFTSIFMPWKWQKNGCPLSWKKPSFTYQNWMSLRKHIRQSNPYKILKKSTNLMVMVIYLQH